MRLDWVHPSWRDLVVEHLGGDAAARRHFLAVCGVDGLLLALSTAGGGTGDRVLPFLVEDADWDAASEALRRIVRDAEAEVAIEHVLDALTAAREAVGVGRLDEVVALEAEAARALQRRYRDGTLPGVPVLVRWVALELPPCLDAAWVELVPTRLPGYTDEPGCERLDDWLALVEALAGRAPLELQRLGWPRGWPTGLEALSDMLQGSPLARRIHRLGIGHYLGDATGAERTHALPSSVDEFWDPPVSEIDVAAQILEDL